MKVVNEASATDAKKDQHSADPNEESKSSGEKVAAPSHKPQNPLQISLSFGQSNLKAKIEELKKSPEPFVENQEADKTAVKNAVESSKLDFCLGFLEGGFSACEEETDTEQPKPLIKPALKKQTSKSKPQTILHEDPDEDSQADDPAKTTMSEANGAF